MNLVVEPIKSRMAGTRNTSSLLLVCVASNGDEEEEAEEVAGEGMRGLGLVATKSMSGGGGCCDCRTDGSWKEGTVKY